MDNGDGFCPALFRAAEANGIRRALSHRESRVSHSPRHAIELITGWLDAAWAQRDCSQENSFEPFVYAYLSLAGFLNCATPFDQDRQALGALVLSDELPGRRVFARLVAENPEFAEKVRSLYELFPIFSVRDVPFELGDWLNRDRSRAARRTQILDALAADGCKRGYEPRCWLHHQGEHNSVPVDLAHTMFAIYQVRCNLFHGKKGFHDHWDQRVVHTAFQVLVYLCRSMFPKSRHSKT